MYSWFNLCGLCGLRSQRWRGDSAVCRRPHRAQARSERAVQYNGTDAEVGGHGSGPLTPSSEDRAVPYTVPMKAVLPQCCTAGAIPSSTFGCLAPGRLWIARLGCSCARVAASRLCCVLLLGVLIAADTLSTSESVAVRTRILGRGSVRQGASDGVVDGRQMRVRWPRQPELLRSVKQPGQPAQRLIHDLFGRSLDFARLAGGQVKHSNLCWRRCKSTSPANRRGN